MACTSDSLPGFLGQIYIDQVVTPLAELKDTTLRVERDTIDVTSHTAGGWKSNIHGLAQWTASAAYMYVMNDLYQDRLYQNLIDGPDAADMTFYFRPRGESSVAGDPEYSGSGIITSWEDTMPNADAQASSVEILGCGPLTKQPVT